MTTLFEYGFKTINGIVKKQYHLNDIPNIKEKCDMWVDFELVYVRQYVGLDDVHGAKIFEGDGFLIDGKKMYIKYVEDRCRFILTTGLGFDTKNAVDLDCDIIYKLPIEFNIYNV